MLTRKKNAYSKANLPYNERIRRYNEEKQSALVLANTTEEAERIMHFLRTKWRV